MTHELRKITCYFQYLKNLTSLVSYVFLQSEGKRLSALLRTPNLIMSNFGDTLLISELTTLKNFGIRIKHQNYSIKNSNVTKFS